MHFVVVFQTSQECFIFLCSPLSSVFPAIQRTTKLFLLRNPAHGINVGCCYWVSLLSRPDFLLLSECVVLCWELSCRSHFNRDSTVECLFSVNYWVACDLLPRNYVNMDVVFHKRNDAAVADHFSPTNWSGCFNALSSHSNTENENQQERTCESASKAHQAKLKQCCIKQTVKDAHRLINRAK